MRFARVPKAKAKQEAPVEKTEFEVFLTEFFPEGPHYGWFKREDVFKIWTRMKEKEKEDAIRLSGF